MFFQKRREAQQIALRAPEPFSLLDDQDTRHDTSS
jgi:hypothetical protein